MAHTRDFLIITNYPYSSVANADSKEIAPSPESAPNKKARTDGDDIEFLGGGEQSLGNWPHQVLFPQISLPFFQNFLQKSQQTNTHFLTFFLLHLSVNSVRRIHFTSRIW